MSMSMEMTGVDLDSVDLDSFHDIAEIGNENDMELVYNKVIEMNNLTTPLDDDPQSINFMNHFMNKKDELKYTALHRAVFSRNIDSFKFLLTKGCDVNMKCNGTPLLHLVLSTSLLPEGKEFALTAADVLLSQSLELKYDLLAKDDQGQTALHLASEYDLDMIVKNILSVVESDSSTSLSIFLDGNKDRRGYRPLHKCALMDSAKSATVLLDQQEVSLEDLSGTKSTPLHVAASCGSTKFWHLLLSCAASRKGSSYVTRLMSLKDNLNKTPLDVADTYGFKDLLSADECNESECANKPITAIISHELCRQHYTCPPSETETPSAPPENIKRLHVLIGERNGCLRGSDLASRVQFIENCRPASLGDVLRVHEWGYVRRLQAKCEVIQKLSEGIPPDLAAEDPQCGITHLDGDTALSRETFRAAMHAAGSVCQGVDMIMNKEVRNVFCAVRPPGHHAGPLGLVKGEPGGPDSHGFCLLNNISIGASYAMTVHRDVVKKVAIVDFDVHHGNGTEETIRWLKPHVKRFNQDVDGYGFGEMCVPQYKPWFGENDTDNVLFVSVHGYGPQQKGLEYMFPRGAFYPGSGKSIVPDTVVHTPASNDEHTSRMEEVQDAHDEVMDNTVNAVNNNGGDEADDDDDDEEDDDYKDEGNESSDNSDGDGAMGNDYDNSSSAMSSNQRIQKLLGIYQPGSVRSTSDAKTTWLSNMSPLILDVGVNLPDEEFVAGEYRHKWRNYFREQIFPRLMEFKPDCIFISAGFDAHRKDEINGGYIALVEEDYDWVTANLIRIANTVCDGRVVSALEGGYMTRGEHCSSFAKSVKTHVASLCSKEGISSSAKYSAEDAAREQAAEREIIRSLHLKRQKRAEQEALLIAQQQALHAAQYEQLQEDILPTSSLEKSGVDSGNKEVTEQVDSDSPRKRRRASGTVDYVALNQKLMEKKD